MFLEDQSIKNKQTWQRKRNATVWCDSCVRFYHPAACRLRHPIGPYSTLRALQCPSKLDEIKLTVLYVCTVRVQSLELCISEQHCYEDYSDDMMHLNVEELYEFICADLYQS